LSLDFTENGTVIAAEYFLPGTIRFKGLRDNLCGLFSSDMHSTPLFFCYNMTKKVTKEPSLCHFLKMYRYLSMGRSSKMADQNDRKIKYVMCILVQSLVYGFGNPLTKIAYESITPLWLLSTRFVLAAGLFLIIRPKQITEALKAHKPALWLPSALCGAGAYISCNLALKLTSATNVGFLMSLPVLFAPVLSSLVKGEKYKIKHLPVQLLAVVGLFLLCSNGGFFRFTLGDFLALLCAAFIAGMLVFGETAVAVVDPVALTAFQAGTTAIISTVGAFIFEDFSILASVRSDAWLVILYLAVTCTMLAYLLQNIAVKHLNAPTVSMLQCTQPILTAAASWLLVSETLSVIGFIGAAIIVISLIIDAKK